MGTSKCGSDMQYISRSHKDLWLEWLDVMVSSVLSGKAPMQLAFDPCLFLVSGGHEVSDAVVQPFILLSVMRPFGCACECVSPLMG